MNMPASMGRAARCSRVMPQCLPRPGGGLGQTGRLQGSLLGAVEVVVAPGHDPLGVEPATGLDVGDGPPAAIGVGGEVADGVEEPGAVLAVDVGTGGHVLAHER